MAIQIPSGIIVSDVKIQHNIPNFYAESLSLSGRAKSRNIHRIEGSLTLTAGNPASQRKLEMFLLQVQGRRNTFELELGHRFSSATATGSGNFLAVSGEGIGSTSIALYKSGSIGDITGGDMFNVINDDKVYMALNDTSGTPDSINIFPPLYKSLVVDSQIDFKSVKIIARLREDIQSVEYTEGGHITTYTLNFIENL